MSPQAIAFLCFVVASFAFIAGYVIGWERREHGCGHGRVFMGTDGNFYCQSCSEWVY